MLADALGQIGLRRLGLGEQRFAAHAILARRRHRRLGQLEGAIGLARTGLALGQPVGGLAPRQRRAIERFEQALALGGDRRRPLGQRRLLGQHRLAPPVERRQLLARRRGTLRP